MKLDPPPSDPREQAVAPDRWTDDRGNVCVGCGIETRHHWTISGVWAGCKGALTLQTPPRNPERWNDPYPAITCEVRKQLLLHCGPAMEIHCARYTHDELLAIACEIAKATVSAYLREIAK